MANHLLQLLESWYPERDEFDWVLGTVYRTEGPCYRKAGAMMLFNSLGQQFGMLSGGCLESDIQQHARRVMQTGQAMTLYYDGSDEDDLSFQLGIGCGGTVYILLQPINAKLDYLQLDQLYLNLKERKAARYQQRIPDQQGIPAARFITVEDQSDLNQPRSDLKQHDEENWLTTNLLPPPHLLVIGGGIDARPVISLASELGWHTSLWDPRPANGRREFFMRADHILEGSEEILGDYVRSHRVDGAVIMSHNVALDAAALAILQDSPLKYLALLGPDNRRQKVLRQAGLTEETLNLPLAGPAGLDLGAELPEEIALAILSECQAALTKGTARSLSNVLNR